MDFTGYTITKIADVQTLNPVSQTSILSDSYHQSTINKNDLQSLSLRDNLAMHENSGNTSKTDGANSHASSLTLYQNTVDKSSLQLEPYQDIHSGSYENPDSPPEVNGDKPGANTTEERHLCQYCDRDYPSRTNLSRHIFRVHRVPAKKSNPDELNNDFKGAVCYEEGCNNQKFKSTTELRNHLVNKHNFIFQVVKNQLETEQQFLIWKKKVEEACNIKWVKQAAKKKASGNTVVTYICHRSGKFRSSGSKRRALKSCKIGHFCTAYLKVVIFDTPNENGKKYSVELYPDHYGHDVSNTEEKKVKVQVAKCLTNPVRGILISTTGVLFENGKYEAIKGSVLAVEKLRQLGITIRFVTNDSRRTPAELVKKLTTLGFTVSENEIYSPIPLVINTLLTLGLRPYLMVHPDIIEAFDKLDQSSPNCVVIGDLGNTISAEMFNKAYQVLTSSPSPVLVKLGNEKYYKEKNELVLGAASYAAALEYACNTEAMVVGKPCYDFIMNAVNGMGICPQEIIMVGDDIENDIRAAQQCGMRAILGSHSGTTFIAMYFYVNLLWPDDAKHEVIKPDTIVKNLAHLVDMLVLKAKREKSALDSPQKYPAPDHQKQQPTDRTPKNMELIPVPVSVPIQVHCDPFQFRFGNGPEGS